VSHEQRIRATLFYLSVFIFFVGTPFILSFALGYKFNSKTLKFTRAGLIAIKTQPQGAAIYLGGKLLNDKTPSTINELLPGKYRLRLELEHYYPWFAEVNVDAGKVTRLEKIILFPLRSSVIQLNKAKVSSFWVDDKKEKIYYVDQVENIIYKADLGKENLEEIGIIPEAFAVKKWKISPDRSKLLCFNPHQIAVVNLHAQEYLSDSDAAVVMDYTNRKITDAFWHSDSYHLILVTEKNIEVVEASQNATPVNLVSLNKKNVTAFYDDNRDTLYFLDSQQAVDGETYDNVYQLDLNAKFSPLKELLKTKTNETH